MDISMFYFAMFGIFLIVLNIWEATRRAKLTSEQRAEEDALLTQENRIW